MKKLYLIITLVGIVTTACTGSVDNKVDNLNINKQPSGDKQVACQKDAKVCEDGTVLGRVGPNCEFPACPEVKIKYQLINTLDIDKVPAAFKFKVEIPDDWEIEVVPQIEALNFYDPKASGLNNLEKSQIFVRYFSANTFLTLNTVTIFNKIEMENNGRPTIVYDIEKKSDVPNFTFQPTWRNKRHLVTDIRESDTNPSTFYVLGKNPEIKDEIWNHFLKTFTVNQTKNVSATEELKYIAEKVNKKPFGIYVTTENSPVQPERFTGYHTGIDIEYPETNTITVPSLADGEVIYSQKTNGYGGVVAIKQTIKNVNYIVIYGHLDPESMALIGKIKKGDIVGNLGEGFTPETDGERKHLHLAFYKGDKLNLVGYVKSKDELTNWDDPEKIIFN